MPDYTKSEPLMSDTVIQVDRLSKQYRLGSIGARTLRTDISRRWARLRGKPDPLSKIGEQTSRKSAGQNGNANDELWALKDVSFEVKQGEVLGIIGRNGAGKSTLLKILSRVTAPTSGEVRVKGRVASLLEIGTGFHPELTGRENIFLNGAILGMTKLEVKKKFDEIVAFSEVEKFIDTPVKRYSSGMYVRLAFGVAAHLEPEILVVDEVLAVGDTAFQKKCLGKMGDVAKEGRTVLFVSHNLAAVRSLCNSCVLLVDGKMDCIGRPDETISEYLSRGAPAPLLLSEELFRNEDLGIALRPVELLNGAGQIVSSLETGQPGVLRMPVMTNRQWSHITATFGVNSRLENYRVCVLYSPLTGDQLTLQPPQTYLVCYLPKVPFMPGRYRLTLKAMSGQQILFYLPEVVEIDVVAGDFFGTGQLPERSWGGPCLIEHRWVSEQGLSAVQVSAR
jgi:lipopolysaccharide transport system ATP-binding protein